MRGEAVIRGHANAVHELHQLRLGLGQQLDARSGAGGEQIFEDHALGGARQVGAGVLEECGRSLHHGAVPGEYRTVSRWERGLAPGAILVRPYAQ